MEGEFLLLSQLVDKYKGKKHGVNHVLWCLEQHEKGMVWRGKPYMQFNHVVKSWEFLAFRQSFSAAASKKHELSEIGKPITPGKTPAVADIAQTKPTNLSSLPVGDGVQQKQPSQQEQPSEQVQQSVQDEPSKQVQQSQQVLPGTGRKGGNPPAGKKQLTPEQVFRNGDKPFQINIHKIRKQYFKNQFTIIMFSLQVAKKKRWLISMRRWQI